MIGIRVGEFDVRVRGHAGYAEVGKDIVCAAVTVLCYALGGMLARAEDEGLLLGEATVEMNPGDIHIACRPKNKKAVRRIFDTALLGMEMVANEYPQNVRIMRA